MNEIIRHKSSCTDAGAQDLRQRGVHELVYSNNLSGLKNHIQLDLSFLLNGIYFIRTKPGAGDEFNCKIVIIR